MTNCSSCGQEIVWVIFMVEEKPYCELCFCDLGEPSPEYEIITAHITRYKVKPLGVDERGPTCELEVDASVVLGHPLISVATHLQLRSPDHDETTR